MSEAPNPALGAAGLEPPRCLRQLAPLRFDLEEEGGRRPAIGRGGYHLRSGQRYTVRVKARPADDFGGVTRVVVEESESLRSAMPASSVATPDGLEYVAVLRPRRPYFLPAKTSLTVTLHHDHWGPYSVMAPVVVWPRVWSQLSLAATLPVTAAAHRLAARLAEQGSTVKGVLRREAEDLGFWLQLLLFALVGLVAIKAAGWIWAALGARTD